ncbi:nuclear factor of activated T-cells, cytoplasmic 2 isoform X2 [Polypterus senegalus]|uniref:nuclear factor of activated T-cells, cytoplasmic 2 isoform X2 n=1 Tax=Polypterus senegalus TaxID=55291 RepID=UPI0019666532|nr:nuclear factor of activated T-cells, cytoplasmic 2 isoform X2 [Polypterus senegalus]
MTSSYADKGPDNLGSEEVNCQDELDFSILFEYDTSNFETAEPEEPDLTSHKAISPPTTGVLYPQEEVPQYVNKSCVSSAYADIHPDINIGVGHLEKYCLDNVRPITTSAVSPRIEITPSHELYQSLGREFIIGPVLNPANTSPRSTLPVPGYESTVYREPACLSPASSNSSASWHSETNYSPWTSPCVSPNNGPTDDLCPQFRNIHTQNSPRTSPGTSPRTSITEDSCLDPRSPSPRPGSRSASPVGKRTYEEYSSPNKILDQHRSRSPSPQAFREDTNTGLFSHQAPYTTSLTDAMNGLSTNSSCNIPTKIVKTNAAYSVFPLDIQTDSYFSSCEQDVKRKQVAEQVLLVPPNWTKQLVPGLPFYSVPVASLPPLEWPLSSHLDNYSLQIDVQPKPHHRAHYETEGSRGAVKAPTGGHPIVQLHGYRGKDPLGLQIFIGTADERILKPHAFYQVHRITGKTVTTTSYEKMIGSTKVLEIPLEPKNNMRAVIDCAGILKLRNADIELRKGETDIGRKNTRVRLVFRVHIPQAGGNIISLQTASNPIECSQRSAHELPMVEKQDIEGCSVMGGQQMILTGQNFASDAKVVFAEKTQDGQQIWDIEATVDKDKSQPSMLFVEVPPYRDPAIRHAVKVNFFVINGKRKRSQPQHFTYFPLPAIKTEPIDDCELQMKVAHGFATMQHSYYHPQGMINSETCFVASCQQIPSGISPPDSRSRAVIYPKSRSLSSSPLIYQQTNLMTSPGAIIQDAHCSVLVHTGSPGQSSTMIHQQSSSPSQPPSSIIQFSPTNHQIRGGGLSDHQHIMYCESFQNSPARSPAPAVTQTTRISTSFYPTVIQQQPYIQKIAKHRSPPRQLESQQCLEEQKEIPGGRVTVKQENLDQAYLDDGIIF